MSKNTDNYLSQIQKYWDERATVALTDNERVDSSLRAQRMRFESFLSGHNIEGKSLLDVGCGTAAFLRHLEQRKINADYTGFDLSPEMIRLCKANYPSVKFDSGNFLDWSPGTTFDYTIAIGIHHIKTAGGRDILEQVTRKQFEMCNVAAHISLLTDRYPNYAPHVQAWRVEEVLALALDITPWVTVRHDYLPNDFSVTLYREPFIDTADDLLLEYT